MGNIPDNMDSDARNIAKMMGKSASTAFQAHIVETCEETETCETVDKLTKSELTGEGAEDAPSYLDAETAKYARMLGESGAKAFQERCANIITEEQGAAEETTAEEVVDDTPRIEKKSRSKQLDQMAAPTPPTGSKMDKKRKQSVSKQSPQLNRSADVAQASPVTRSSKRTKAC